MLYTKKVTDLRTGFSFTREELDRIRGDQEDREAARDVAEGVRILYSAGWYFTGTDFRARVTR